MGPVLVWCSQRPEQTVWDSVLLGGQYVCVRVCARVDAGSGRRAEVGVYAACVRGRVRLQA